MNLLVFLEGAFIREQGVEFGVVVVQRHVLSNHAEANRLIAQFQAQFFNGHPVVLMAQSFRGRPTYYGRQDIVNFMAGVPLHSIPWKRYTFF